MSNTFDPDSGFPKFLVFQLIDYGKNTVEEMSDFQANNYSSHITCGASEVTTLFIDEKSVKRH